MRSTSADTSSDETRRSTGRRWTQVLNDTKHWILVKGFWSDGISVAIYGGERRRVVSSLGTFAVRPRPREAHQGSDTCEGKTVVEQEDPLPAARR